MKKYCIQKLIWLICTVHNWCYKCLTKCAIIEGGGLHPKHRILDYHTFFVNHVGAGDVVVDIGCGNGANAFDVAQKAKEVVGIDMNTKNIEKARKKYSRANLSYLVGDATTYQFGRRFDAIVLSNVLEHIEHRVPFLRSLHAISDTILLRVPMIDRDWVVIYKQEHGIEYRLDPTHYIEYTDAILRRELTEAGWRVESHSVQFGEWWGVVRGNTRYE